MWSIWNIMSFKHLKNLGLLQRRVCFKEKAETGLKWTKNLPFNTFIKNNFNLFIIDKTRSYLLEYRRAAIEPFLSTVIWVKNCLFPIPRALFPGFDGWWGWRRAWRARALNKPRTTIGSFTLTKLARARRGKPQDQTVWRSSENKSLLLWGFSRSNFVANVS